MTTMRGQTPTCSYHFELQEFDSAHNCEVVAEEIKKTYNVTAYCRPK
jgi:hypothetical protein